MARRTKAEAQETRAGILAAAGQLFRDLGYAPVTLEDIARQAGVTKGAVYGHFRNKEEVLFSLLEQVDFAFEGERLQEHDEPGIAAIRVEMRTIFLNIATEERLRTAYVILMHRSDGAEHGDRLRQRRELIERECEAFLRYHWQMATALGEAPEDMDIKMASHLFRSYIVGLLDIWLFNPALFDLGAEAARLTENYLDMARALKRPAAIGAGQRPLLPGAAPASGRRQEHAPGVRADVLP